MRLSALAPEWYADVPTRRGQGMSFRCPHCTERMVIMFSNPLDGSSSSVHAKVVYARRGMTFENISIEPRIFIPNHCRLVVANGQVTVDP